MKVLSIHYGHNSTVSLSVNGEIVCLISEERLSRVKNATGYPSKAIDYIATTYLDGDLNQLDKVTIVDGKGFGAKYLMKHGLEPKPYLDYYWKRKAQILKQSSSLIFKYIRPLKSVAKTLLHRESSLKAAQAYVLKSVGIDKSKVEFVDHHTCHATSAAYFAEVNDGSTWLILTLDGEGDGLSSTVSTYQHGELNRISENSNLVSLGYLFAETTAFLGMKPNEHEFKLMGMAPYADPEQVHRLSMQLKELIWLSDTGQFETACPSNQFLPRLIKIFAFERFDVISGAIQKVTEELICNWAKYWSEKTNIHNVAVSGGVFMNVKAAKRLAEMSFINKLFVVPSASDESLPIGALWLTNKQNNVKIKYIESLYLGREFSDSSTKEMIERENLAELFEIQQISDQTAHAEFVAELLANNEIVARCCGREEWGARALGNRSILCNPSNFQNIERLNSKIKCRDFWMPFTPSVISEDLMKYAINPKQISAPYMAITFDSTEIAKKHLAAAVHPRDFTMRPQAVFNSWNPDYYLLISKFKEKTGISGLLNTSFNLHGEPNVSTPEDAVRTVLNSGLNYLVLGSFILKKKIEA